jgi:hypothetical protein
MRMNPAAPAVSSELQEVPVRAGCRGSFTYFVLTGLAVLTMASAGLAMVALGGKAGPAWQLLLPGSGQQTGGAAPAPQDSTANQSAQDQPNGAPSEARRVTLPAGSVISVRLADNVDSSHGHVGDLLTGTVDPSVLIGNQVVIPRGTEAHMRMVEDKKGHHLHGKAEVELELVSLVINGQRLFVESDSYKKEKRRSSGQG